MRSNQEENVPLPITSSSPQVPAQNGTGSVARRAGEEGNVHWGGGLLPRVSGTGLLPGTKYQRDKQSVPLE